MLESSCRHGPDQDFPFNLILWYGAKKILLYRNRTNFWCRSHMYFRPVFFPLYVVLKIGLSTIRYFFNTHLFSNIFIMTLNYFLCPISVQNPENVHFEGINLFPLHQHTETINSTIRRKSRYITSTHCKNWKTGIYQGSAECCDGDCDSDLNRLASVVLRQYTTVTNHC